MARQFQAEKKGNASAAIRNRIAKKTRHLASANQGTQGIFE
jgi:hypothetical protein